MANKKIVVALGRNAFSESFPKQQERVKLVCKSYCRFGRRKI